MNKNVNNGLAAIRRKDELELEIRNLLDKMTLDSAVHSKGVASAEARSRLASFIQQNGGSDQAIPPGRQGELRRLQDDLAYKQREAKATTDLRENQTKQLASLREELAAILGNIQGDDLAPIDADLAMIANEIASLTAAIEEQEALASGVTGADGLAEKRDELLADAALGKDVKKQLAEVEEKLATAEKKVEKCLDAEQAVLVLSGRLDQAKERRAELLRLRTVALGNRLLQRGDVIEAEYLAKAQELGVLLERLIGIDELLQRQDADNQYEPFCIGGLRSLKLFAPRSGLVIFSASEADRSALAVREQLLSAE